MNRQEAWDLLCEYTKTDSLRKHALAVEAAMRAYAGKYGEDEEKWGTVGLLHDFDYEKYPSLEDHPMVGSKILREKGYPEEMIKAILSHADRFGVERKTPMEKALYAVDELVGLIIAVALVRPSKSLMDMEVKSIKKKWKDKAFAKGVSREDIERGVQDLGVPLDEHLAFVLKAMQSIAGDLGLDMQG